MWDDVAKAMQRAPPIGFPSALCERSACATSVDSCDDESAECNFTTIMVRDIPNSYTQEMLLDLLNSRGLKGLYNFVYLPLDFKRWSGLGYAFVNLVSNEAANKA